MKTVFRNGIIGGAIGFLADVALVAVTPVTGGASLAVLAAKKAVDVAAIGVGVVAGTAVGTGVTKVCESKKQVRSYRNGYEKASSEYEKKFADQSRKYERIANEWEKSARRKEV